jgi:TRAP-type C4-dicarboxylate transport system substrate-binding protein
LLEAFDLPTNTEKGMYNSRLLNDFYKKFKPKELDKVKVLFLTGAAPMYLHSKKPVKTLQDLKGMKIRVPGGTIVSIVKGLGAVPLVMSVGETYDALRKGVADATMAATDTLQNYKYYEVCKYTTFNPVSAVGSSGLVVMNKAKWDSLPPDIQSIIDKTSAEYSEKFGRLWDERDEAGMKYAKGKGHIFITLTKEEDRRWLDTMKPMFDKYVQDKTAMGLPAKEALQFIKDWVAKNKK